MKRIELTERPDGTWAMLANFAMDDKTIAAISRYGADGNSLMDAARYRKVRAMNAGDLEMIAHQATSAEDFDAQIDEWGAA